MARRKKSPGSVILVLIVCAIVWWLQNRGDLPSGNGSSGSGPVDNSPIEIKQWKDPVEGETAESSKITKSENQASVVGGYDRFPGCRLVDFRNNDGDSFMVRFPNGEKRELRLYFVDTPESAVKEYRDGNSNRKRISYQGKDMGGLSERETVAVGAAAKKWVLRRLDRGSFTVYTKWQEVFDSGRYYSFISVKESGGERWLHELLVEQGLARIYTEGTQLPNGTSKRKQEGYLRQLEKKAKSARAGAWGK